MLVIFYNEKRVSDKFASSISMFFKINVLISTNLKITLNLSFFIEKSLNVMLFRFYNVTVITFSSNGMNCTFEN